ELGGRPVPPHAEHQPPSESRARRDARGADRRRATGHPHRRERLVFDRPAAIQRTVRRAGIPRDRGWPGRRDAPRRGVSASNAGVLELDGSDRRPEHLLDRRRVQRRQGSAGPVERGLARLRAHAPPECHRHQHRNVHSMREPTWLSEDEARELARRTLAMSAADEARVNISSSTESNTRFAGNQITTSGDVRNATVTITSAFGSRLGAATTNRLDDASLQAAVATSERLARLVPEDPEYLGQLGPQRYADDIDPWFESTATMEAEERAEAVRIVTRTAEARGLISTGYFPVQASSRAVATSRGLFAFQRSTGASFSVTARTADGRGSGWAGTGILAWNDV